MTWTKQTGWMFGWACAVVVLGCGAEPLPEEMSGTESVGTIRQEVITPCMPGECTEFTTSLGLVTVRIWSSGWQGPGPELVTRASIDDSNFVLVGGGAEIADSPVPGGLLVGSYPRYSGKHPLDNTDYYKSWEVRSKDHIQPSMHRLRAFAIGLRLAGYSATQLRQQVSTFNSFSLSPHSSGYVVQNAPDGPDGAILLSGGVRAWYGDGEPGRLLVSSAAANGTWRGVTKDHWVSNPGPTQTWAIYITERPPGLDYYLQVTETAAWSSAGGGYQTATRSLAPGGWAPVGVSARQDTSGQGRLLTDMHPLTGTNVGATVTSKDHVVSDSDRVQAGVRLLRGNWNF